MGPACSEASSSSFINNAASCWSIQACIAIKGSSHRACCCRAICRVDLQHTFGAWNRITAWIAFNGHADRPRRGFEDAFADVVPVAAVMQ